jgi:hypothetical protein
LATFDFVFSLFGLLLGLSLAELFSGLSRALKARGKVRVGWLTPLLGLFVIMDLTSFWTGAWALRQALKPSYPLLLIGVAVAGLYYLAASLVFPDDPERWPDFDAYYLKHRRQVLCAVWLCNLVAFPLAAWWARLPLGMEWAVLTTIYTAAIIVAMWRKNLAVNTAAISLLIFTYLYYAAA